MEGCGGSPGVMQFTEGGPGDVWSRLLIRCPVVTSRGTHASCSRSGCRMELWNFGRNVISRPRDLYTPRDEAEVLRILDRHAGQRIRVVGSWHSWSRVLESDQVLLDLRHLNHVEIAAVSPPTSVRIGGGCQIKQVLAALERLAGMTLPSVGFISEQTVAGAISTSTHGSGAHSLSQYVLEVRVARYDQTTGQAAIVTIDAGDELLAARCSLGALGIILSVTMQIRPLYHVEETFREYRTVEDVLAQQRQYPLQQFYLVPWRWTLFAQHRREVQGASSATLWLYQWYRFLVFDVAMHLVILTLVKLLRAHAVVRAVFRWVIPACVVRNWSVIGPASRQLIMEHELFRCVETEVFVRGSQLSDALQFVKLTLVAADNARTDLPARYLQQLADSGTEQKLQQLRGRYCHHYPICVRRVLPEQTLISMASEQGLQITQADGDWFAITLTNYHRGEQRRPFDQLAEFLTGSMATLFAARPHWGKICQAKASQITALYPGFERFRELVQQADRDAVFRNDWTAELLQRPDEMSRGSNAE